MLKFIMPSGSALLIAAALIFVGGGSGPSPAHAVVCAKGVYRAGCAGPRGAVAVQRRPPAAAGCRYVNGRRVCGVVR